MTPRVRSARLVELGPGQHASARERGAARLAWVVDGTASATLDGRHMALPPGSVLVVPPDVGTAYRPSDSGSVRMQLLTFDDPTVRHTLTAELGSDDVAFALLRHIADLYDAAPEGWERAASHTLLVVLHALSTGVPHPSPAAQLMLPEVLSRAFAPLRAAWRPGRRLTQPDVRALAAAAGTTPHNLTRVFRAEFGLAPSAVFRALRLHDAAISLVDAADPVAVIAWQSGFDSTRAFTTAFRGATGMTPTAFRRSGATVPPLDPRLRVVAAYALPYPTARGWEPAEIGFVPQRTFQDGTGRQRGRSQ